MTIPSAWISLCSMYRSSFKTQVGTEFTRHRNLGFHSWRMGKGESCGPKMWHSTIISPQKKPLRLFVVYSEEHTLQLCIFQIQQSFHILHDCRCCTCHYLAFTTIPSRFIHFMFHVPSGHFLSFHPPLLQPAQHIHIAGCWKAPVIGL